jgi:2-polyprenyl-3-methyl-5-hydroxy-6-metoxy-1,4-benzoquinol methylase
VSLLSLSNWTWPKRRIVPELLETFTWAHTDVDFVLRDLVRINHHFGGHSVILQALERAGCGEDFFSLVDIGAASGDSSRIIHRRFPGARCLNLDRNAVNLASAPEPKIVADAFNLPFSAKSFDYVFCSSFLHHFADEQVVELLKGFAKVAKKAVVVVDLERHRVPHWFLRISSFVMRWHWLTVHDGRVSVRASFRAEELCALAVRAGLQNVVVRTHRPAFRLSLVAIPYDLEEHERSPSDGSEIIRLPRTVASMSKSIN